MPLHSFMWATTQSRAIPTVNTPPDWRPQDGHFTSVSRVSHQSA